jgi:DedD protein
MNQTLRQRLVGAAVLAGLAVIFLPALLDDSGIEEPRIEATNIPPKPDSGEFSSRIVPLDTEPAPVTNAETAPVPVAPESPAATKTPPATAPAPAIPEPPASPSPQDTQRTGVVAWVVQLGSFDSEKNATDLEKRLQKAGYAAFIDKHYPAEGRKYRVRVGPELARAKADGIRDKLEKELKIKGIVVRYP